MHEEQFCQPRLDDGDRQHAPEHLRCVNVLIGNDELQACQGQQTNIDENVLPNSISLVHLPCCHSILLPCFFDLVRQVQKVDQRYDEHPNQIHEVPVKA